MKIFKIGKDGGDKSNVTGFWLVEIKNLFSVVILKFAKGSRENYHNHAFNALTWFVKGNVDEHNLDGRIINWKPSWKPKLTKKDCFHKVFAIEDTYVISFRGPWDNTWKEFNPTKQEEITLTHGRKRVLTEGSMLRGYKPND